MEASYKKNDFDLEENRVFEKRAAIFRSVGKSLIFIFILGGITGVFGYAKWTKKEIIIDRNFSLQYESFLHARKETPLQLVFEQGVSDSAISVSVNADYFESIGIKSILPSPTSVHVNGRNILFEFKKISGPGFIIFNTYPAKMGLTQMRIFTGSHPVSFNQFIYP